ncbi:inactive polyglycylase TTLL10 [Pteropus alecto]|uniref:inactive polyglycylase TTLL10 n=1 Tax=Pteropus alecto TaxID=9402 RepID=UPI000D5316B0|nr:inactive polyglycylase TTLL10 [Pteropus alecto]
MRPVQRLGLRAARRPRRRVGTASSQRCPCPGAPTPVRRSHTRFTRRRGPTRTQAGAKRGKRSGVARARRSCPREPGRAHERPMGSRAEGLPRQPGQPHQDTDEAAAVKPRAALLERHVLWGELPPGSGCGPFFYIGGSNGASIISSYCKSKGWQRIQDSRREDYRLKWCEIRCRDSYHSFREGEQLLFQLPNNKLLTTKIGLLSALREHSRATGTGNKAALCAPASHQATCPSARLLPSEMRASSHPPITQPPVCLEAPTHLHSTHSCVDTEARPCVPLASRSGRDAAPALEGLTGTSPGGLGPQRTLKMEDFFPETYRLDMRDEREAFFTLFDETQMWICKPTACNQGKGIFLLRSQEEVAALQAKTQSAESDLTCRKTAFRVPQARVVQRYIQNPLLLDGRKFDVRAYLLIACAVPHMVFFRHGYARLTLGLYDPHSRDLSGHLTNQFMQKKSPLYMLLKEDTVWSMDHLNRYINDKFRKTKGLPRDWVFTAFTTRMQQIMAHCFLAVKSKLECKLGYFDLIGCDFLIDENFKVWLLEMNSNPALHTNCEVLKEVIPAVVMETLGEALLQPGNPQRAPTARPVVRAAPPRPQPPRGQMPANLTVQHPRGLRGNPSFCVAPVWAVWGPGTGSQCPAARLPAGRVLQEPGGPRRVSSQASPALSLTSRPRHERVFGPLAVHWLAARHAAHGGISAVPEHSGSTRTSQLVNVGITEMA